MKNHFQGYPFSITITNTKLNEFNSSTINNKQFTFNKEKERFQE